ncbi:MAG: holo-ACP synthase [Gemmatimonadales bacterium]|nr:holo-ACP synthase [Gemmatimonadales bacterium]
MSTLGVGTDLVEVDRIEALLGQHPVRFLDKYFRPGDLARSSANSSTSVGSMAESWAAKEAFLKALGTEVRKIPYRDVELISSCGGTLSLNLYGMAENAARQSGVCSIRVSVSSTPAAAVALVVLGT